MMGAKLIKGAHTKFALSPELTLDRMMQNANELSELSGRKLSKSKKTLLKYDKKIDSVINPLG